MPCIVKLIKLAGFLYQIFRHHLQNALKISTGADLRYLKSAEVLGLMQFNQTDVLRSSAKKLWQVVLNFIVCL